MGTAAGTAAHAAEIFASCEPVLKQIPADYRGNWQKKYEQAQKLNAMATDKAKSVFFE